MTTEQRKRRVVKRPPVTLEDLAQEVRAGFRRIAEQLAGRPTDADLSSRDVMVRLQIGKTKFFELRDAETIPEPDYFNGRRGRWRPETIEKVRDKLAEEGSTDGA